MSDLAPTPSALLAPLQELLTGLYDVPLDYAVADFLITDRALLPAHCRENPAEEQVLVQEDDDGTALAVFLDPALLSRLAVRSPLQSLEPDNLADAWTVLEGISHFQYLAHHARHDRGVSVLELELQAEVDKYAVSGHLFLAQTGRLPRELVRWLFEHSRVDPARAGDRVGLYQEASRRAADFCQVLDRVWRADQPYPALAPLSALRRFYRRTPHGKHDFTREFTRRSGRLDILPPA